MKRLTKSVYYVKQGDPDARAATRLWHDCPKRGIRVELAAAGETGDEIKFSCPSCGFAYALDKNLTLA